MFIPKLIKALVPAQFEHIIRNYLHNRAFTVVGEFQIPIGVLFRQESPKTALRGLRCSIYIYTLARTHARTHI
jgi:hypothetical protein